VLIIITESIYREDRVTELLLKLEDYECRDKPNDRMISHLDKMINTTKGRVEEAKVRYNDLKVEVMKMKKDEEKNKEKEKDEMMATNKEVDRSNNKKKRKVNHASSFDTSDEEDEDEDDSDCIEIGSDDENIGSSISRLTSTSDMVNMSNSSSESSTL
jgi:hypothetical protein